MEYIVRIHKSIDHVGQASGLSRQAGGSRYGDVIDSFHPRPFSTSQEG
jgi:hypothetical protein